ncbi:uncharacterized protein LOC116615611 [Nematostella vectensis]|uniref:uncharacterized protein LOC116615611 n=1 Tax=Nematostella vectensis TaxID=45351 RepID=UPI0013900601|nr:uncharacterized protein LOC116615611 [Nematostella vectensis]
MKANVLVIALFLGFMASSPLVNCESLLPLDDLPPADDVYVVTPGTKLILTCDARGASCVSPLFAAEGQKHFTVLSGDVQVARFGCMFIVDADMSGVYGCLYYLSEFRQEVMTVEMEVHVDLAEDIRDLNRGSTISQQM